MLGGDQRDEIRSSLRTEARVALRLALKTSPGLGRRIHEEPPHSEVSIDGVGNGKLRQARRPVRPAFEPRGRRVHDQTMPANV